MNTNKKFDDIMKEIIQKKNKSIMSEYEKMAEEAENIRSSVIDENLIKAMIEHEKKDKERRKKKYFSILSKVAILLIACIVSANFIFPESVNAFRTRILDMFFNENSGSVSLRGETEADMIGNWNEYYYPQYIPEGYKLLGAEKMGERIVMVFVSNNREHELKIEELPINSNVSIDTNYTNIKNVKINSYEGVLSTNEEYGNIILSWATDKKILSIHGDVSIENNEYIKIAENLNYIER